MVRIVHACSLLGFALALPACQYELDTERRPAPRGSFGEEIHRILQQDLDRLQPAKGQALGRERERFVRAVDALMPEPLLAALQAFLIETLPLYDAGRMQAVLRPAACVLGQELAADEALQRAVWYARRPAGYGADEALLPLLLRLGQRPDAADLIAELVALFLAHDGLDSQFCPGGEDDTLAALLAALSGWLAERRAEPVEPAGAWAALRDWLLSADPRLRDAAGGEAAQWVVRVDARGRALVAPDPASGAIPPPFVDGDRDGLADLDPHSGDYLDAADQPLAAPPPFDAAGERTRVDGRLVYRYAELGQTPLAAALAQLEPLLRDGLLWQLPDALPALLGPTAALTDERGVYAGHDPDSSPAVALVHAGLAAADTPRLPQLLETLLTIAEHHEAQLARLVHELEAVAAVVERYPDTNLRAHNSLLDDLMPHLIQMAERAYLLRILESFADPRWHQLGPGLAEMIRYRSVVPPGWNCYDDYDTYAHYLQVRQPTDFAAPDSAYANRSNLQRGVHLIHDTHGIPHSFSVAGWEPFPIPDMLAFYLDSSADLVEVEWYVASAVLEFSDSTPTTEEVNRFMVADHDVLGNPVGREGHEIRCYNGEALMAMEFTGLLDGLRPMWTAVVELDRGDAPSGTEVLEGLLAAVHPHYSANVPHAAPACAGLRPLEPMLLEILETTEVVDALVDLLASLQDRETPNGYWVIGELDRLTRHLLQPDAALRRHDGATSVPGGDGATPVAPISRLYLLLDALRLVDRAVADDAQAEAALERAAELIADRFLAVERDGERWRFANRQAWLLLLNALDFLRQRARAEIDAGTLSAELAAIDADFRELVAGRTLPRLLDAWRLLLDHPTLPGRIDGLALDLLDRGDPQRVRETRRLAAWCIQHLQVDALTVPLGHSLAARLDPDGQGWRWAPGAACTPLPSAFEPKAQLRWVSRALALVGELLAIRVPADDGPPVRVAAELLANATAPAGPGQPAPLEDLLYLIGAIHRADPLASEALAPADLAAMLGEVADYLLDEARGIEKLYLMIERRDGME